MMARRRHAALALVVGLMAGVTNRGFAQARVGLACRRQRQHLAGTADSRAGDAGAAGARAVQRDPGGRARAALSRAVSRPHLVGPVAVVPGRLAAAGAHGRLLPRPNLRPARQLSRKQIVFFPVRSWLRLVSPTRSVNDVVVHAAADVRLEQPGRHPAAGAVDVRDHHHQHGERTDQAVHGQRHDVSFRRRRSRRARRTGGSVRANMVNGPASDQITANSPGTFVIQTAECPTATLLYQNFPNPFGGGLQPNTCFWFDLAHRANVSLNDLRPARAPRARRSSPACCRRSSIPAPTDGRAATEGGCNTQPPVGRARRRRTQRAAGRLHRRSSRPTGFARPSRSCIRGP